MTDIFSLTRGDKPLIISIPHLGTQIPEALREGFTDVALTVADTDWHLDRLYECAADLGATVLAARLSRYVVDLNRPSTDESLYPGQTTTGLCPTETFRGEAVYRSGFAPDAEEKQRRVKAYWQPYHETLRAELNRLRQAHANVLLWEAHSIASVLPRLFEGKLPDLNLGTQDGRTAAPELLASALAVAQASPFTSIANGRFKGGFITRSFGQPEAGIHAVQLEMCQSTYMNEDSPYEYMHSRAEHVQPVLRDMIERAYEAMRSLA